jgi:superfamily II DNA/RNA helicase
MPNFGTGSSRPDGRKPRHGKTGAPKGSGHASEPKYKPREDGRGGRSPQRQAFFEAKSEPRAERSFEERRDDRGARPDRNDRGFNRDDRGAGRPKFDGADRGSRFNRDDRGARPAGRDDRGARPAGREDGRRDWAPREDRPRFDRDDRGARPAGRDERGARPAGREDGRRDWAPRDDRGGRGKFERSDRPRFERDDRGGERRFDRTDRVERDRSRDRSFEDRRATTPNKKAFAEDVVLERLESATVDDSAIVTTFEEMALHPRLVEALVRMGAEKPFPIQAATIPAAVEGRDVLGRGKTGSGKTVAFTVPVVTKLVNGGSRPRVPNKPRALILAPTRELADQIDRTASQLARSVGFYTTVVYGGVPQRRQEIAMSRGVDILVATPGRLEDLMAQRIVDLSDVETIVIDEADHMCDLGFIEGVRRIMSATGDSQKLLFSATLDREVDALVKQFMPDPFVYEVPNEDQDTSNIIHRVLVTRDEDRSPVLLRLVQGEGKALIFCRTKATAESLSESLTEAGVPAARLHGDLNQSQRNRNLERFTRGNCRVLVATDVAARGIHVDDVALVIQVDPPLEYKTYLHRSGRTGRAGKEGTVVTMVPRQRRRRMEDLLNRAERDGIFTDVWPAHELLEELAGPIAPPPAVEVLDFGSGNGGGRGGDRQGRGEGGGRGRFQRDGQGRGDRPRRDGDRPGRGFGGPKRRFND